MEKKSNSKLTVKAVKTHIDALTSKEGIPDKYGEILKVFFESYKRVITAHGEAIEHFLPLFSTFLDLIEKQFSSPHLFAPYHKRIRRPFDYHQFGIDFLRPLVHLPHSTISGLEVLKTIIGHLGKKENVILLANHQIEADPIALSILLESNYPQLVEKLIFVAGARVTSDPFAIPFSMGYNLLCIYSKKYIDHPPEEKHAKQIHNKGTMKQTMELLSEGGHAIYVAPSGGRDRMNEKGELEIAPFDPQSIEMFYLMARKAKRPTHFHTLTLSTYHLLPPPEMTKNELGETRVTHGGALHLAFGPEIDMEHFPGSKQAQDKHEKRRLRAEYLWNFVKKDYQAFPT